MPGWVAAAIGVAGLGMQAAGMANAPGAPGSVVGRRMATMTPEEKQAHYLNMASFNVSNNLQNQFNAMQNQSDALRDSMDSTALNAISAQNQQNLANRKDLKYLDSPGRYNQMAGRAVSEAMAQMYPQASQAIAQSAARSGGPGSGAFFAANQGVTSGMGAQLSQANLQGRMGNLGDYLNRWQQNFKNEGDLYQQRKAWLGQRTSTLGQRQDRLDQQSQGLQTALGIYNQLAQNAATRAQGQLDYQTQLEMARQGASYQGALANSQALSAGGGLAMSAANTASGLYGAYQNAQAQQGGAQAQQMLNTMGGR